MGWFAGSAPATRVAARTTSWAAKRFSILRWTSAFQVIPTPLSRLAIEAAATGSAAPKRRCGSCSSPLWPPALPAPPTRHYDIDRETDELGASRRTTRYALASAVLDEEILPLDVAKVAQPLPEGLGMLPGARCQVPNAPHLPAGCAAVASGTTSRPSRSDRAFRHAQPSQLKMPTVAPLATMSCNIESTHGLSTNNAPSNVSNVFILVLTDAVQFLLQRGHHLPLRR